MDAPLKICICASEFAPLAKTGGLADVAAALALYLHRSGHDVRVLIPDYSSLRAEGLEREAIPFLQHIPMHLGHKHVSFSIDALKLPNSGLSIYLLRCPDYFDRPGLYGNGDDEHLRFILLSRAAIEMCQRMGFAPNIFSTHDWHTALIPLYLKSLYSWDRLFEGTRSLLTIHNIGYQGAFGAQKLPDLSLDGMEHLLHQDDLAQGMINMLRTGVLYADCISTVSPTYAQEILTDEYGMGLQDLLRPRAQDLIGILNGVDGRDWNPANDHLIPANFTWEDLGGKRICKRALMEKTGLEVVLDRPLFGVVTRLVSQKGIDLIQEVLPRLLSQRDLALVVLGSGEPTYEQFFQKLHEMAPSRVFFYRGYNEELAHWIEAGSDVFLMPSRYEPCGLNQMYSLAYGTLPVVRGTGGLADSVKQINPRERSGTGIVFRHYDAEGLNWAMLQALDLWQDQDLWQQIMRNAMQEDFSWERQGEHYVDLFRRLIQKPA
ncbi:MAG: glycogen synthase [Pseudomonadota bacterium]